MIRPSPVPVCVSHRLARALVMLACLSVLAAFVGAPASVRAAMPAHPGVSLVECPAGPTPASGVVPGVDADEPCGRLAPARAATTIRPGGYPAKRLDLAAQSPPETPAPARLDRPPRG